MTRRTLLRLLWIGGILLAMGRGTAWSFILIRPKEKVSPKGGPNPFTENGKSLAGVAWGEDPGKMIRNAVNLIGGFEKLDCRDKTVLVKPNVVSRKQNPATTNPMVVKATVELLYQAGARKVFVGDMSALLTFSTLYNMSQNGIRKAAEEAGAEVVAFEDHEWLEVDLPQTRYVKKAYVTEWLYRVDRVINLPVIKTHRSASYSICLKNFIGCTHLRQRPYLVDYSHWEEVVAEFNAAFRPDLNIVDGTVSMTAGGPWEGTAARTNLIIASGDRVAADVIGLSIIRSFGQWEMVSQKNVWDQRQIRTALELGLGSGRERIGLRTGPGDRHFLELMEKVRHLTDL